MPQKNIHGLNLPQTSIFGTEKNVKYNDKNIEHIHLSSPPVKTLSGPQSLRLETTANYNIQSKGVREKVLGLETVSILKICIMAKRVPTTAWTNVHESRLVFKERCCKTHRLMTDRLGVHVLSAWLDSWHAHTASTAEPYEIALYLDSSCITEQNELITESITEIISKGRVHSKKTHWVNTYLC